jgi:hypothetical protein
MVGTGLTAAVEPTMTIDPPRPVRSIAGMAARQVFQVPVSTTSIIVCHCSGVACQVLAGQLATPALATTTSSPPKVPSASSTAATSWSWSRTSTTAGAARPPASSIIATVAVRSSFEAVP